MRTFARDPKTNDLVLVNRSDFKIVEGREAVGSIVDSIVNTVKGEMLLDVDKGVPHFMALLRGSISLWEWRTYMIDAVESCEYVAGVTRLDTNIDRDSGVLSYEMDVLTKEGYDIGLISTFGVDNALIIDAVGLDGSGIEHAYVRWRTIMTFNDMKDYVNDYATSTLPSTSQGTSVLSGINTLSERYLDGASSLPLPNTSTGDEMNERIDELQDAGFV